MGKRIIQQRRGRGGHTYRVRQKASLGSKPGYLKDLSGEYEVIKLIASPGHSVPIAKLTNKEGQVFYNFSTHLLYVGQKIKFGGKKDGDISCLGDLKNGTTVFNIEHKPKDGGKFIRTGGNSGTITNKTGDIVTVAFPSKKEKKLSVSCRATVGIAAGDGRMDKPILKAGKKFYIMKSKSKLWPRTSAVAMNAIDHPFGSGRGKRVKSKIIKRNASPGKKVGLLRPRRTGRKKR
jgi:large subunit ribosomal protein L2